ncbi:hypothetical protein MC7420_4453 [Coleofasciculus chthonoplastes PCC 7420]|uniref:Uncharacterized protein n=1 Tax=Coleofasciculus chthonoplastes PCC 7420 TaxID=118168 RepID=B4VY65_9CYAN|nr:hypothetical protein [Coleofasciculus chthonoplastes]EDX73206.1 hypothetical protein MC7420_4453 [Coleofasciculus chthonoplastes PCC 7420]
MDFSISSVRRFCTKSLIYLFLVAMFLVVQVPAGNCQGDLNVEVEIETGPEFDPTDAPTIWACVQAHYHNKFPFDFVAAPAPGVLSCPNVVFWDRHYELCWILDIYHKIEPAIILGMLISAVLWL